MSSTNPTRPRSQSPLQVFPRPGSDESCALNALATARMLESRAKRSQDPTQARNSRIQAAGYYALAGTHYESAVYQINRSGVGEERKEDFVRSAIAALSKAESMYSDLGDDGNSTLVAKRVRYLKN